MSDVFENLRVNLFKSDRSKTVAFVSCKVNTIGGPMFLNNMTLVSGANGIFLSFPSRKLPKPDNSGKEYQNHYFMGGDLKKILALAAIAEYEKKLQDAGQGQYRQDGSYNGDKTPDLTPPGENDIPF